MADGFKLPGSSYDEIVKIVMAYSSGKDGDKYSLATLKQVTKMDTTVISRNNGFLMEIGIVLEGQMKTVTSLGYKLGRAYAYDVQEDIVDAWSEMIDKSEFLGRMLAAIRIRNGMDRASYINHILYSSGNKDTTSNRTGANTIIEILLLTKRIKEVDGKIVIYDNGYGMDIISTKPNVKLPIKREFPNKQFSYQKECSNSVSTSVNLVINLNIDVSLSEFDGLANKVKTLLDELNAESTEE